jgi:transcriptional antiterminator RfaH
VRSTKGVQGFVRFGETPQVVPDSVVASVRSYLNPDGIFEAQAAPQLVENCRVRIDRGCFEGYEAIFKAKRGRDRIIVLLNILSEFREIEVSETSVSVVALAASAPKAI